MEKEQINRIESILDVFLEEYEKDHSIIRSDLQKGIEFHRFVNEVVNDWKKSKKCVFENCNNKSIRRSHSIQKSTSLRVIAEHGLVLTPEYTMEGFQLKEKGIGWASTFPGFCETHEKLFEEFENKRGIGNHRHYVLQVYRSICREIVRLKHEVKYFEKMIDNHNRSRNQYLVEKIKNETDISIPPSSVEVNNDHCVSVLEEIAEKLNRQCQTLQQFHLRQIQDAIENQTNEGISIIAINIDTVIPVCLSGLLNFKSEHNGTAKTILSIINVLPYENNTHIVLCGRKEDNESLKSYLSHFNDSMSLLNMIEAWMILETDHWFLMPSVWLGIREDKKKEILLDLNADSDSLVYKNSIFNNVRKILIKSAEDQINTPGKQQYFANIIRNESKKLTI